MYFWAQHCWKVFNFSVFQQFTTQPIQKNVSTILTDVPQLLKIAFNIWVVYIYFSLHSGLSQHQKFWDRQMKVYCLRAWAWDSTNNYPSPEFAFCNFKSLNLRPTNPVLYTFVCFFGSRGRKSQRPRGLKIKNGQMKQKLGTDGKLLKMRKVSISISSPPF